MQQDFFNYEAELSLDHHLQFGKSDFVTAMLEEIRRGYIADFAEAVLGPIYF